MVLTLNSFQDVTSSAGINWSRQRGDEAFSVAWTDFNNDGLPDLWIDGHGYNNAAPNALFSNAKFPALYINNGDGTFTNLFTEDPRQGNGGDTHVATLIDYDNDGDADAFTASGGELGATSTGQANILFNNRLSRLGIITNEAASANVEYSIGRSRASVWFDFNQDGLLDFVNLVATREDGQGSNAYFEQQTDGTFTNRTNAVGFDVPFPSRYAQLADLTGDGKLELIIQGTYQFPVAVYNLASGSSFQDITNNFNFPLTSDLPADINQDFQEHESARDSIIADFDNDGDNDIFLVRSLAKTTINPSVFQGTNPNVVSGDLILRNRGSEIGYSFQTGNNASIAIDFFDLNALAANLNPNEIFIGSGGRTPTTSELEAFVNLSSASTEPAVANDNPRTTAVDPVAALLLSSASTGVEGLPANRSARGVYIGLVNGTWEIRLNSPRFESIRSAVESTEPITNLSPIGFTNVDPAVNALTDLLWLFDENTGQFVDSSVAAGLTTPTLAQNTVAGDFDNDKDLDLYLVNSYTSFDQPNILYENQGNGTFISVPQAGGAAGTALNFGWLDFEVGARAATADYDGDGFLDIFLGSTVGRSPRKTYLATPFQLFKNQGNSNNWLNIKLQGTQSNRDGVGSQVRVTSGGTTQLREQNGGTHNFAQNEQRLHFGLAQDSTIEQIEIQWASGITQILNNVAVNQTLTVVEPFANDLIGNNNSNRLFGNPNTADKIEGLAGDDTLNGLGGNDRLIGNTGSDRLMGDAGNDTLDGGDDADILRAGSENDLLLGGAGDDTLDGGNGDDTLEGGLGEDSLLGGAGFDLLLGDVGSDTINGNAGDDLISGHDDADILRGNNGNDTLDGGADSDRLWGGNNNDLLQGSQGEDILNGNNGNDTLEGGDGNDTVRGQSGGDFLSGGGDNDTLKGGDGSDSLSGDEADDNLDGEGGFDLLFGGTGNDLLRGGNGDDTLAGGSGSDRLIENGDFDFTLTDTQLIGRGIDPFSEMESAQITAGGRGNILDATAVTQLQVILKGGGGQDTLNGGSLDDELEGQVGQDLLSGGTGSDRFLYLNLNHRNDTITDFVSGTDSVAISAAAFGGELSLGTLAENQFVLGNVALDADDRFLYNTNNNRLLFDADGSGATPTLLVATFTNDVVLSNQDIEIIA
ncbi:MAG TPA: FG-GAP-like repeat-containing protein [Xenococcaceae cyanobacterium]